jgi:hypothetical protein
MLCESGGLLPGVGISLAWLLFGYTEADDITTREDFFH